MSLGQIATALRYAARSVRRAPAVPAACAVLIAVGAGAATAVFAMAYGALLRPLPFQDSDRLVELKATAPDRTLDFSLPEFDDWQRRPTAFRSVALFATAQLALAADSQTRAVTGAVVSGTFFETLGARPLLGRTLTGQDDRLPVVVVSERLWRRLFAADSAAIGQSLTLNGEVMTVVGVVAAAFGFPSDDIDVWMPVEFARQAAPPQWNMRGFRGFSLVARLRPGVALTAAGADAIRVAHELASEFPRFNRDTDVRLTSLREALNAPSRPVLLLLVAAVGLVLIAVCANVSNLLGARAIAERREVAVRLALGASRRDIAAEVIAYAGWIAGLGAAGGLALAALLLKAPAVIHSGAVPRPSDVRLDLTVFMSGLSSVVFAMLISCALPHAVAWKVPPIASLREARSGHGRRTRRWHDGLVVLQIAASVTLLVGAALLGRTLATLLRVDSGVRANAVYLARIDMTGSTLSSGAAQTVLLTRMIDRVAGLPGIGSVALISSSPPDGSQMRTTLSPSEGNGEARDVQVEIVAASPLTFTTLGVPLRQGRAFTHTDGANAPRAVILSETAARRLFPGRNPIGLPLPLAAASGGVGTPTVVGVVGDVRFVGLTSAEFAAVYLPFPQRPFRSTYLAMRAAMSGQALTTTLAKTIYDTDPGVALGPVRSWNDVVGNATAQPRYRLMILLLLTAMALTVATVGLYGVLAYVVSSRKQEFAVRMALGAQPRQILGMVLSDGARTMGIGVLLGAVVALASGRWLSSLLFGVPPTDPLSFAAAASCIAVVGLLVTWAPAWRASRLTTAALLKGE